MIQQTVQFTIMPRGLTFNPANPPVSVLVSPRLSGADRLGKFPDWLDWTARLKEHGLKLVIACGAKKITVQVDTKPLRPDLWREMFNKETYVRSYAFKDYTGRAIFSYPVRLALSAIKSAYQQAGYELALPEREDGQDKRHEGGSRRVLKGLLDGFQVNWNQKTGESLRERYRGAFAQLTDSSAIPTPKYDPAWLNADGTLNTVPPGGTPASKGFHEFVAGQFAVYSHMPQGQPISKNPPDFDKLIDFHQALSALNSYPELLRALGLVFDFDLPAGFVAPTPVNAPGRLAVVDVPDAHWQVSTSAPPAMPAQETADLYFGGAGAQLFSAAPGLLGGGLSELDVFGLLYLDPARYGLAQMDVESGMHKTLLLAESWQAGRLEPNLPEHPEIFDETTTLPALRSGGISVYADARSLRLARTLAENKKFNQKLETSAPAARPFYAEDLNHGYRVDIWDSFSNEWHSLHRRIAAYTIGELAFAPKGEVEGFVQLAAAQAAPDPDNPPPDDIYLNESMARWAGWSLSAPFPGKALSRDPDPAKALDEDPDHPLNEPATPFKMTTSFKAAPKSLPALRFGRRYRLRMRAVDLCGNSMAHDDPLAGLLALISGLPRDPEGLAYLRYEPVPAPLVVLRDERGVTGPGSQLQRLVMRTFNADISQDGDPPDLTASDRFIVPPGTNVEMGERLGMFDTNGKLDTSSAMYDLIGARDAGKLNHVSVTVAGKEQSLPLEPGDRLDAIPYLPDVLARGAALRNLPGSPDGARVSVEPGAGAAQSLAYSPLEGSNPRPGSAALVGFGGGGDWQRLLPFRLALADGSSGAETPEWDPQNRVLTVHLPKGQVAVTPLSSYVPPADLKLLGVWQWLREIFDLAAVFVPGVPVADPKLDSERLSHILQRSVEGGHWMLTPPTLLTLVHAVQQPLGRPAFVPLSAQHKPYGAKNAYGQVDELVNPDPKALQTAPEATPTAQSELHALTAWRRPGSPEASLIGALQIHAASTGKVDLAAEWADPYDDPTQPRVEGLDYTQKSNVASVEEIPLPHLKEGVITTGSGKSYRQLAFYDADHDLLCFTREGDQLGNLKSGVTVYGDAAPRHYFNDTRRHRVRYTPLATSRFREYFDPNAGLDFTRSGEGLWVDVPASERPAAPQVSYIVPTFGWQRETQTNLKRSVRFGGGLRVYLERPWFSSGMGELLGVALYDYGNGSLTDREKWKSTVTQWGADPIWLAPGLSLLPDAGSFPNRVADEYSLSLPGRAPGRVGVAGFTVDFDYQSQKWFADLTVDAASLAYTPFIRLALTRYQPFALPDSKLSAAVLADYIQLTPERSALLTADPYHPRRLRLTVSGPAPAGPAPQISGGRPTDPVHVPTRVEVTLQRRTAGLDSDLAWQDAPAVTAAVSAFPLPPAPGLLRWSGTVTFTAAPEPGEYRVLIREYEYLSANYLITSGRGKAARRDQPKRLIYAETVLIDSALVSPPSIPTGTIL
jgi:hypothetical protein